jgi:hypothetical protein
MVGPVVHHEHFEAVMLHGDGDGNGNGNGGGSGGGVSSREVLVSASNQPSDSITERCILIATTSDNHDENQDDNNTTNLVAYYNQQEDFMYNQMMSLARKKKELASSAGKRRDLSALLVRNRHHDDPAAQQSQSQSSQSHQPPDWTIHVIVQNADDDPVALLDPIYHVHRSVVAFGPRRSAFLARAMLKTGTATATSDTKTRSNSTNHHQKQQQQQPPHDPSSPRSVAITTVTTTTTAAGDHCSVQIDTSNSRDNNHLLVSSVTSGLFRMILSRSTCSDVGVMSVAAPDYSDLVLDDDDDGLPFPTSSSHSHSSSSSRGSHTSCSSGSTRNSSHCTTRLHLEPRVAQVVPIALEYMYSSSSSSTRASTSSTSKSSSFSLLPRTANDELQALGVQTDNATALYTLAELLEIKSLCRTVQAYIQADLNNNANDKLVTYYQQAMELQQQQDANVNHHNHNDVVVASILNACEDCCARRIFKMDEATGMKILKVIDPLFFLRVVTSPYIYQRHRQPSLRSKKNVDNNKEDDKDEEEDYKEDDDESVEQTSRRLSLLISTYVHLHQSELTPLLLAESTNVAHLPVLDATAAKALLQLEHDIAAITANKSWNHNLVGPADYIATTTATTTTATPSSSSSLQERAIAAISQQWLDACFITVHDNNNNNNTLAGVASQRTKSGLSVGAETPADSTTPNSTISDPGTSSVVVSLPRLSSEAAMRAFTTKLVQQARRQILERDDALTAMRQVYQERLEYETKILRDELQLAQQTCRQAQETCRQLQQAMVAIQQQRPAGSAAGGPPRQREPQQQKHESSLLEQQQPQQPPPARQYEASSICETDNANEVGDDKPECSLSAKIMKRRSSSSLSAKTTAAFKQHIPSFSKGGWWQSSRRTRSRMMILE